MIWLHADALAARLPTHSREFALLCNDLLLAVADRHGIDRTIFDLTERINEPDGGVDARCRGASRAHGRLIPGPNVIYQFKGGTNAKAATAIAKDDILGKRKVMDALREGQVFVYMAAWSRKADFESDIIRGIRDEGADVTEEQIVFIGGYTIATLLQNHLGVLARHVGGIAPFRSLAQWERQTNLSNPFCTDDALEGRLRELTAAIETPSSRVRVVGRSGNGKTRSVLEAIRGSSFLGQTLLYAPQPDDVSYETLDAISRSAEVQCTIVIDEVDAAEHERLINQFGAMPPGVRLVTIGLDASPSLAEGSLTVFEVPGLNDDILVEAMSSQTVGAPEEAVRDAARACGGSPKLALLLAERMKLDPTLMTAGANLADLGVRGKLDRFLKISINDPAWEPIAVASLLDHVGWADELEHESVELFEAAALAVGDARLQVHAAGERHGITQRTRRLLYVSPAILADHLAIRWLESRSREELRAFYEALPAPLQDRFGKRLRRIAQVLANRSSVEEVILGPEGPFRTLEDLERSTISSLLARLAGPLRHATAQALSRVLSTATDKAITEAVESRRVVVNAITELLWWEDTFKVAAPLLLRLAVNENETWANNATGVWIECFQTRLGRTAADWQARAEILSAAAGSDDPRARVLAAKAIAAGLQLGHFTRMGMPPREVPDAPGEAWFPKDSVEWIAATRGYLEIVRPLLADEAVDVRTAATDAVAEAAHIAYILPSVMEDWSAVAGDLKDQSYSLRSRVVERIEWVLARGREEAGSLDTNENEKRRDLEARLNRLDQVRDTLVGNDFSSLFRRAIEADPWRLKEDEVDWEEVIEPLIDELLADPSRLDEEWNWLLECEGSGPERLANVLGRRDSVLRLEASLHGLAETNRRATRWLSLYLLGRHQAGDAGDLIEERLADFAAKEETRSWALDLLTVLPASTDRSELLVKLFEEGAFDTAELGRLKYTQVLEELSPRQVARLAEAASGQPGAETHVVGLLHYYLHHRPDTAPHMADAALSALDAPPLTEGRKRGHSIDYEWSELAKHYVESHPLAVAQAALRWVETTEAYRPYGFGEVLERARRAAGDEDFFQAVTGPWLDREETLPRLWGDEVIQPSSILALDPDFVIRWVAEAPGSRARRLARVVGAPIGPTVSELHSRLLEEFDDDFGVGGVFFAQFVSGTWTGSAAARTRGLVDRMASWASDDRPAVRGWARKYEAELRRMLERDELIEEEEPFRW